MTLSLNKSQIHSDSMEKVVTKIQIKNKSEPLLDKNKEIFHINQSVRHTVIFNLQCEFFSVSQVQIYRGNNKSQAKPGRTKA